MNSYLNKTFVIDDPKARVRKDEDLLSAVMIDGQPKLIPIGTHVKITDAKVFKDLVFVRVDGFGWTSKNNLKNKFLNETLRTIPPPDNDEKGPNAAWDRGHFLKQITLIEIIGAKDSIKYISAEVGPFYLKLVNDAEGDSVLLALKSGFRTYASQQFLHSGFISHQPGFNLAAKPGFSNHQD